MTENIMEHLRRINYLSAEINSLYHQAAVKLGLSDSVMHIMYMLYDNGGSFMLSDICRVSGISKQTVILVAAFYMLAASQLLAQPLARFFVGYDAQLMEMTVSGFRIFATAFLLMGFSIYGSSFFTALNDGLTSALIAFLRTMVFECSVVLLLPRIWGVNGVWSSVVVAECMAVILTFMFLGLKKKKYNY